MIRPIFRAFRRFDRADPAVMGRMHVAHFEARALAGQTASPSADRRRLWVISDSGLVWSMNCDSCERAEELAHRRRRRLGVDQVMRHHGVDLDRAHALADRRSMRSRPRRNWFSISSPTERTRRLPR